VTALGRAAGAAAVLVGVVCLAAPSARAEVTAAEPLAPPEAPALGHCAPDVWSGNWNSEYGPVVLMVAGRRVVGSYGENGRVRGTLDATGCVLAGSWDEEPTRAPPAHAGTLEFRLAPDGSFWNGTWAYGGSAHRDSWNGWRGAARVR
jgi:hypothetical protein